MYNSPEIRTEMPGGINKRLSQGIHDDLLANAMVLDDGNTQLVLAGINALSVKRSITWIGAHPSGQMQS